MLKSHLFLAGIVASIIMTSYIVPAYSFVPGNIFGIETVAVGVGDIYEWNPVTKTLVNNFPVDCGNSPHSVCNGRGLAFDGTDLWYSVVDFPNLSGDGLIHKIATTGGNDITTIPDPYGLNGRGIGALDYDFNTNSLWAISYLPSAPIIGNQDVLKLNPANGAVLASCTVPKTTGGAGSETLALDPNGLTFWTNAGEPEPFVNEYGLPVAFNAGACVPTGNTFNPTTVDVGGLDFDSVGSFIIGEVAPTFLYDMGATPSGPILDSFNIAVFVEDITLAPFVEPIGGTIIPIDNVSLILSSVENSAFSILSALVVLGAAAFGALYYTTRKGN